MPRIRPFPAWFCFATLLALLVAGCESKTPPADASSDVASSGETGVDATSENSDDAARQEESGVQDEIDSKSATTDPSESSNDPPPLPAPAEEQQAERGDAEQAKVPPGADPLVPPGVKRPTTEGWWRIVFSFNGNDFSAGFLHVGKDDAGKIAVREIRTNDVINPAKLVNAEATETTIRLFFEESADNKFDYTGTLQDNVIRGNLQFLTSRQNLVRLVPIEESQATDEALDEQRLGPTFGLMEVIEAIQSGDSVEGVRNAARTWRNSPAVYLAYDSLFVQAKQLELDRPTLEVLAKEFAAIGRIWGERAEQAAKLNIALDLWSGAYETDLALEQFEQVQKQNPELVAKWENQLAPARRIADVDQAYRQIGNGEVDAGLQKLRELHAAKTIDPTATYRLAAAELQHGSKEEAFQLFSRLAAQPQAEAELGSIASEVEYVRARTAAAKLYEEQHGNRDGFDEYLAGVYRDNLTSFLADGSKNRQATDSERTALVELFTGAMCPPCVAADVATEAIVRSFPASDVVVLRYHMNIPGPDPLSSTDSEDRSEYYGEEFLGTPTIFVDGTQATNVAGPYSNAPAAYENLASVIADRAAQPAGAKIELSAKVEGDVLKIDAKASGFEQSAETLRLRIAVAESEIDFEAPNGIRVHEMVIREMPGGAAGIAAVNGTFAFQQDVPLVETRERLVSFLDGIESQMSERTGQPFAFDERPMDLRRLTVIAFLQDDATHEVLQTAVVPIEQDVELPALAARSSANPFGAVAADNDTSEDAGGPSITPPQE